MNTVTDSAPAREGIDYTAVKRRQQAVWAAGDFAVIGNTLQIVGETLAEAADIRAGERVLDVAAGNGNASLAAARRHANVTAIDYVPALLDKGAARAAAEGLQVRFEVADAEALPYADAAFDAVLSTFGAMFAPQHERCTGEMLRVLRGGGRIGLANWTPEGFIGQLFGVVGRHVPPPAGVASPALWGTEAHLATLFGAQAQGMQLRRKQFNFRYRSPGHWLQVFRDCYGPVQKAFEALPESGRHALAVAITALLARFNTGGSGSLVVPGEYLEVIITRRGKRRA